MAKEKKMEKAKKIKSPKDPKAAGKTKAAKPSKTAKAPKSTKSSKRTKKEGGSGVAFFRTIQIRLICSFLVPVICIIVLGIASYQKASDAIINSYKSSVEQTLSSTSNYLNLGIATVEDNGKSYLNDGDLTNYFAGLMTMTTELNYYRETMAGIRTKIAGDDKLSEIYLLGDSRESMLGDAHTLVDNPYTAYCGTAQGAVVKADAYAWHVFGQDSEADDVLGTKEGSYVLRIVRHLKTVNALVIIDVKTDFVRNAMSLLDAGDGGYVALITSDGKEFYADSDTAPEEALFVGTDFYQEAVESEDATGNANVTIDGTNYMFIYSKVETGGAITVALIPESIILAQTQDIKQLSVILTVVAALIALALGTLISRQMSGTIQYILRQLRKVSKGDLTVHLVSKKKDEFGLLCEGVNETVENVKALIVHVNEVSTQLNDAAAYVADASTTFMETSHDIQQAVSEIEVGVNKLDSGSEDCLTQMDSLSGKISNVSQNADEIGKLTSSTGNTINNGIESVQGLTSSAESTTQITRHVITAIGELEEKSKSISKIVSAINDIAEQTNLLSLNASIEAARAGEAGKGFAVVAEEIRKLSDQCLNSAGQISNIVNEIVAQTGDVVEIARKAEEVVSTQAGAVEETTSSFRLIDQQVESLLAALNTITSNVQEMSGARSETLEAIESISAVSAETAACSSSVYSTAGTQLNAIQDLDKASQQLRERADALVEILGSFTV